jgi:hypothetical protein
VTHAGSRETWTRLFEEAYRMKLRLGRVCLSLTALLAVGAGPAALAQPPADGGQPGDQPAPPAASVPAPFSPAASLPIGTPGPSPIRRGQPISVLSFDFQNASQGQVGGSALAQSIRRAVEEGLMFSGEFYALTFAPRLGLVRRAQIDELLQPGDLTGVITDGELNFDAARKIAYATGMQTVLAGAVEAVELNRAANTASVTITVQLLDTATGETLRSASVTGNAIGTPDLSAAQLLLLAGRDAAARSLLEFDIALDQGADCLGAPPYTGGGAVRHCWPFFYKLTGDGESRGIWSPTVGFLLYMTALLEFVD